MRLPCMPLVASRLSMRWRARSMAAGIDPALVRRHIHQYAVIHLVRQLLEHVLFEPAQKERPDLAAQRVALPALAMAAHKLGLREQVAGQNEIKDRPQLARVVFHGRSR